MAPRLRFRFAFLGVVALLLLGVVVALFVEFEEQGNRSMVAGPLVIDGENGKVYENLEITSKDGPCVTIKNSKDITIRNSYIGPCGGHGVEILDSSNVRVLDSYVHPEFPVKSCCDTANGIFAQTSNNVLIKGNVVAYGESNVQLLGVQDVQVIGNFLLNPLGPFPRGTQIQSWAFGKTRSSDILIDSNYTLASRDPIYAYTEGQTDAINLGYTDAAVVQNNYIMGGQYHSGCGLIADDSANRMEFLNNTVLDTGGCGIGIADGTNNTVDGNRILIHGIDLPNVGNTALYVWKQYASACGPVVISNNTAAGVRPNGQLSSWWKGTGCDATTLTNNTFDQAAIDALTPTDSKLAAPAIPPLSYERRPDTPFTSAD